MFSQGYKEAITVQRTPLQRAAVNVSAAVTDEGLMGQQYFDEAEAGASLIAVLAPEPRLVTEAREIVSFPRGAAHQVLRRQDGSLTYEDIDRSAAGDGAEP